MDALAIRLDEIPGVDTFTLDPTRVIGESDGVTVALEQALKDGNDVIENACWINSSMTIVISIYVPRPLAQNSAIPGSLSSTPVWKIVDPFYQEIHNRMMGSLQLRQINGLALDTSPVSRERQSDTVATVLRCIYSIDYRTSLPSVTQ